MSSLSRPHSRFHCPCHCRSGPGCCHCRCDFGSRRWPFPLGRICRVCHRITPSFRHRCDVGRAPQPAPETGRPLRAQHTSLGPSFCAIRRIPSVTSASLLFILYIHQNSRTSPAVESRYQSLGSTLGKECCVKSCVKSEVDRPFQRRGFRGPGQHDKSKK